MTNIIVLILCILLGFLTALTYRIIRRSKHREQGYIDIITKIIQDSINHINEEDKNNKKE